MPVGPARQTVIPIRAVCTADGCEADAVEAQDDHLYCAQHAPAVVVDGPESVPTPPLSPGRVSVDGWGPPPRSSVLAPQSGSADPALRELASLDSHELIARLHTTLVAIEDCTAHGYSAQIERFAAELDTLARALAMVVDRPPT